MEMGGVKQVEVVVGDLEDITLLGPRAQCN